MNWWWLWWRGARQLGSVGVEGARPERSEATETRWRDRLVSDLRHRGQFSLSGGNSSAIPAFHSRRAAKMH